MDDVRRGRPRDPAIDARVLAAAVDEIAGKGLAALSTRAVAARAGVDRRGVHARWATTEDLAVEAVGTLTARLEPPLTGTLRGDLRTLAPRIAAAVSSPRRQVLQRCVDEVAQFPAVAQRFRREYVDRCAAVLEDAFHRAAARGELTGRTTPAQATELFMGSLLVRALTSGDAAVDERSQQVVVDHVVGLVTTPSLTGS
ncbi:TetR/AcrR family transcriptional regulator [Kineococcus sp. SYSU DK003]|uniref:TetR/AcrR family transcriptional regulator n=1 Tax=Kineococcus sp. SYSU DK003 TaxID=3383124 RepID=UPI003D7E8263